MRVRHILYLVVVAAAAALALAGCELFGFVSIDQRISKFQDDLNASDHSAAYENFHPDKCSDYNTLKGSSSTLDVLFPVRVGGDAAYSLSVTSEGDTSNVRVTVTGGPGSFGGPKYLNLSMATTGLGDNRIVSLELETSNSFPGPPQIQ